MHTGHFLSHSLTQTPPGFLFTGLLVWMMLVSTKEACYVLFYLILILLSGLP